MLLLLEVVPVGLHARKKLRNLEPRWQFWISSSLHLQVRTLVPASCFEVYILLLLLKVPSGDWVEHV